MPKSKSCFIKINVNQAISIREGHKLVIDDARTKFKCVECGKPVRPTIKTTLASAHFSHLRRNPDCSLSDHLNNIEK